MLGSLDRFGDDLAVIALDAQRAATLSGRDGLTGNILWRVPIGTLAELETAFAGPAGDVNRDGIVDVLYHVVERNDFTPTPQVFRRAVLDGATGAVIWGM
ncbi:MAG: hypothetical protein ACRERU_04425 [Methylococcales bacterium]